MKLTETNIYLDPIKILFKAKTDSFQMKFLPLMLATLLTVAGCSSNRVLVQPVVEENQSISYDKGQLQLKDKASNPLELTIVDYSGDEMIIEVSVSNTGDDPFDFSDQSVKGKIISPDRHYPVNILRYDTFLRNSSTSSDDIWRRTGSTAVSVGSAFIPYGGIASSVAKLLLSINQEARTPQQNRIDARSYLRRHTVEPNTDYGGKLKISLPKPLESGDVLMFEVSSAADEIQDFQFICR